MASLEAFVEVESNGTHSAVKIELPSGSNASTIADALDEKNGILVSDKEDRPQVAPDIVDVSNGGASGSTGSLASVVDITPLCQHVTPSAQHANISLDMLNQASRSGVKDELETAIKVAAAEAAGPQVSTSDVVVEFSGTPADFTVVPPSGPNASTFAVALAGNSAASVSDSIDRLQVAPVGTKQRSSSPPLHRPRQDHLQVLRARS